MKLADSLLKTTSVNPFFSSTRGSNADHTQVTAEKFGLPSPTQEDRYSPSTPVDIAEGVQLVHYHFNMNTCIIRSSLSLSLSLCMAAADVWGQDTSSTSLLAPCTATPHPKPSPSSNICLRFLTDLLISKCKEGVAFARAAATYPLITSTGP